MLPVFSRAQNIDTLSKKEYGMYQITQRIDSLLSTSELLISTQEECNLDEQTLVFFCSLDASGKIIKVYSETTDQCPAIIGCIIEVLSKELLFWPGADGSNALKQLIIRADYENKFNWSSALR